MLFYADRILDNRMHVYNQAHKQTYVRRRGFDIKPQHCTLSMSILINILKMMMIQSPKLSAEKDFPELCGSWVVTFSNAAFTIFYYFLEISNIRIQGN